MAKETDRVRRHTAASVLASIDADTRASLLRCAQAQNGVIDERLRVLEREWDIDRIIETEAPIAGLVGIALGVLANRRLLVVPGVIAAMMCLFATTGRYPLSPILRRMGVRTANEIQRERYALKALRGDFAGLGTEPAPTGLHQDVSSGAVPAKAAPFV